MLYSVNMLPAADADLRVAFRNMTEWFGGTRATVWRNGLLKAMKLLETDPERFAEADEAGTVDIDLRCLFYDKRPHVFRVQFSIDGDTVHVHRIRHAAQDYLVEDDL